MEEMREILNRFGISDGEIQFEKCEQGLINQTYFLRQNKQRKYVLQQINEYVFSNVEALQHNLKITLPFLKAQDYAGIDFYTTIKGDLFTRSNEGNLWRLMPYLPSSLAYHNTSDPEIAFETGRILGVFHRQVDSLNPNDLQVTFARFHNLDWRLEQYEQARNQASAKDISRSEPIRELIDRIEPDLLQMKRMNLPSRVCHNDTKLNNVLFSEEKKAMCLIDLDTLMPGLLLYDFGDAIRTLANPAAEEETDLGKIDFSLEMFEAFVNGFALSKSMLMLSEVESLSFGPVYMPFLHGIRAYTDFLLGNPYYKVTYPDQNLDRAHSLLHFAELARKNQGLMGEILKEKLI